jgi:RimJ/RimL family protein N-acetyltransferase
MKTTKIKVDDRVLLKLYSPEDAEAIFNLIENNVDHINRFGVTVADRYPNLNSLIDDMQGPNILDTTSYGIWDRATLVGSIHYRHFMCEKEAEIGYWLGEEHQRKGYVTRSAATLVNHLFTNPRLERITAIVNTGNTRSQKVLETLGFQYEPMFNEAYVKYVITSPVRSFQPYTSHQA